MFRLHCLERFEGGVEDMFYLALMSLMGMMMVLALALALVYDPHSPHVGASLRLIPMLVRLWLKDFADFYEDKGLVSCTLNRKTVGFLSPPIQS